MVCAVFLCLKWLSRQDARFKKLDDSTTGRVAETVYRGKDGKKMDPAARRVRGSRFRLAVQGIGFRANGKTKDTSARGVGGVKSLMMIP